jgi:hypothetical protein
MLSLLHPRPAPPYRCSTWLPARGPGRGCRRPPQTRPQRIGQDLDHRTGRSVQPSQSTVSAQTASVCPTWTRPVRTGPDHGRLRGQPAAARAVPAGRQASPSPRRSVRPAVRTAPAVSTRTGVRCPLGQGPGAAGCLLRAWTIAGPLIGHTSTVEEAGQTATTGWRRGWGSCDRPPVRRHAG